MHSPPKVKKLDLFTADYIQRTYQVAGSASTLDIASALDIAQKKNQNAANTFDVLSESVRLIDQANAWPSDVASYYIQIVDGELVETTYDSSNFDAELEKYRGSNLRIKFGLDVISSPMIKVLSGNNSTVQQAITFILCHEIFHLSELSRQFDCDFLACAAKNGFARSVRPEMNQEWKAAIHSLTNEYRKKMTLEKRRSVPRDVLLASDEAIIAADFVSEACADLQALAIYEQIYGNAARVVFQSNMIAQRIADEQNGGANYKIGNELAKLLPILPDLTNATIVVETWKVAKNMIAAASDADPALKSQVANINFTFTQKLQELPTKKSAKAMAMRLIGR